MDTSLTIASGSILLYRLYDVSYENDLGRVESMAGGTTRLRIERKRFSKAFEFSNPPVSIRLESFRKVIGEKEIDINSYAKLYDYGAASVIFELLLNDIPPRELVLLAKQIRRLAPLEDEFRARIKGIKTTLKDAMNGRGAPDIEEDYTVYLIRDTSPPTSGRDLLSLMDMAGLMYEEEGEPPPGADTMKDLLSLSFSYSDHDLTLISWDNALVVESGSGMDIPDLLEFANAQLLELRVYDQMLDKELDSIHSIMGENTRIPIWRAKRHRSLAARVMRTVSELTEITERIDNSLKVTDDVYYARVYSAAVGLFRVKDWEMSIRRKLDLASRVYTMLNQEISSRRSEILEGIIILLIALEILIFVFS